MQQRYYDPIAGRFLSVDPIVTDAETGNLFGRYVYAENNPYLYVDPDGREPDDIRRRLDDPRPPTVLPLPMPAPVPLPTPIGPIIAPVPVPVPTPSPAPEVKLPDVVVTGKPISTTNIMLLPFPMQVMVVGHILLNARGDRQAQQTAPQGEFWKGLKPYRGKTKTNGLSGGKRRFYQWDYTHGDVEVYGPQGGHLGSANPETGDMTKPPVEGRELKGL